MVFQGNVSEIDPFSNMGKAIEGAVSQQATAGAQQNPSTTQADEDSFASRVRRELQREHPGGREPEQNSGGSETPRPHLDESSSRLTEILGRVSPSKTGFNYEYQADCPSAVPSPLHNMPGSHMPPNSMPPPALRVPVNGATSTFPETLSDGSNILTHFYMCNTHMDVLGRTLYDIITEGRAETRSLTHGLAEKQSQLVAAFERQLEEVKNEVKPFKTQMRDLSRTCESVLEQGQQHSQMNERLHNQINQMIASKVEKILDVVKEEVVDRLEKQAKKNAELEDTVKSLQKTVQELQKAVEAKDTAPASKTQVANPFSSPLPQHRPQASLGAGDSIRREMQAIPEGPGRNDPRLQYNYGGASNGAYIHGNTPFSNGNQQWYRPSTAGNVRDGKNDNNAYPGSPYMGMGMGNGTSFGGYFSGGQNDHGYGGYSGTPK